MAYSDCTFTKFAGFYHCEINDFYYFVIFGSLDQSLIYANETWLNERGADILMETNWAAVTNESNMISAIGYALDVQTFGDECGKQIDVLVRPG